ncbi:hypothetical protein QTP88_017414 [Uroleucon formosanum]
MFMSSTRELVDVGTLWPSGQQVNNKSQNIVIKKAKLFKSINRFEILNQLDEPDLNLSSQQLSFEQNNDISDEVFKPPPPIFVRGVINYLDLCTALIELIGVDNFFCKTSADRLKIQTSNSESYRALIHFLKEQEAEFHTYQLKQDKPLRVVIRNLHPTTNVDTIKEELKVRLFEIRRVTNVLHKVTKIPIPLFFVDLELSIKSAEIFHLSSLYIRKSKSKSPTNLKQSANLPTVRNTVTQKPTADTPRAASAVAQITSPLTVQINARIFSVQAIILQVTKAVPSTRISSVPKSHISKPDPHSPTYAQATSVRSANNSTPSTASDLNSTITNFLEDFKSLINPQISLLTKVLHNFVTRRNLKVLAPPGPTYWPSSARKNPDILDIFITKIPNNIHCTTENIFDLNSDHSSVLLTLNVSPLRQESPKLFNHTTNKIKFHDIVKCSLPTNRLPSHKQKYNKLANHLNKLLAKLKTKSLESFLTNLSNDGSLWKTTKNACKTKAPNVPIKNNDSSFAISDAYKAELFKLHLSEIFQPHPDIASPNNINSVEEFLNSPLPVAHPVKHFTPNEVKYAIDKYPLKKSPGFDHITAEVARCLPGDRSKYLRNSIFGTILKESCHYHAPDGANIQVREMLEKIKGYEKGNQVFTRNLINEAVLPLVVAAQLSSQSLISRTISRVRSKVEVYPQNPLTVNDLNIPLEYYSIMIDFEQPFTLAFKDVFPNSEIKGYFFHFQQCIWCKIQENGLQNMYAEYAEFSLQIRHLCALAFVPIDKSVQYFNELIESNYYVENENILSPMISYFEDTWIVRPNRRNGRRPPMFSVNMWNCYESVIQDLPRTNNSVEGWYHAFNAALGANHVSIWKFIRFLKHEQLLQEVRLEKRLLGEASPTCSRKYRDHDKK